MKEQEERNWKIDYWNNEIKILQYILEKAESGTLSPLENGIITGSVRDELHSYYRKKYEYGWEIKYPTPNSDSSKHANEWVVTTKNRLQKIGVCDLNSLYAAIEEYKSILDLCCKLNPQDKKERKIKALEAKYKLWQKDDIFFTPQNTAKQMVDIACIDSNSIILEPSAGTGAICDEIKKITCHIDCCEVVPSFQELLELKGYNVVASDFLQYQKESYYDAIIMNPPFSKNQDIDHLKHAFKLLKDGGRLVCITSPHWTFAKENKCKEFGEWLDSQNYHVIDLPSGTFEMTNVHTKLVVLTKSEEITEMTG